MCFTVVDDERTDTRRTKRYIWSTTSIQKWGITTIVFLSLLSWTIKCRKSSYPFFDATSIRLRFYLRNSHKRGKEVFNNFCSRFKIFAVKGVWKSNYVYYKNSRQEKAVNFYPFFENNTNSWMLRKISYFLLLTSM